MPRAWDIGFTQPCINCQGKSATHFVYFWTRKTLPYTHLEAILYIPQQGQSLHIWNTSLSTTGRYKNKYTIQLLKLACISRFAVAISSSETELALGTIRVKDLGAEITSIYSQTLCVCSNANPPHYYALRVPHKADRWHWVWSIFSNHAPPLGQTTLRVGRVSI